MPVVLLGLMRRLSDAGSGKSFRIRGRCGYFR
jgi:hypothetical protein